MEGSRLILNKVCSFENVISKNILLAFNYKRDVDIYQFSTNKLFLINY